MDYVYAKDLTPQQIKDHLGWLDTDLPSSHQDTTACIMALCDHIRSLQDRISALEGRS